MAKKRALPWRISDAPTQQAIRALNDGLDDHEDVQTDLDDRITSLEESVATGSGVVTSVSAGSSMVTAAPTTGDVIVNVVPANLSGIPESGITNLVSDLAGKVSTTRTINTTAPLSGGGDLSADRTLSVNLFGSGVSGVVPASGGGTVNFLRADGNWTNPVAGYPTGSGTLNKLPKWTPSGTQLGDSAVTDDGTAVTVAGILNVQNLRGKAQTVTTTGVATITVNADTTVLRFNPASLLEIVGFTGGADGRIILCENIGAANVLVYHENAGATAANRIKTDANTGSQVMYNGSIPGMGILWYDGTSSRWKYNTLWGYNSPTSLAVNGSLSTTSTLFVNSNTTLGSSTGNNTVVNGYLHQINASNSAGVVIGTSTKDWTFYMSGTSLVLHEYTGTLGGGGGADWVTFAAGGAVSFNGNVTLGDANTDTHTVNGSLGINSAPGAGYELFITPALGGTNTDAMLQSSDGKQLSLAARSGSNAAAITATNGFTFSGSATFQNDLAVSGNVTLGDSTSGDGHTINGRVLQGTAGFADSFALTATQSAATFIHNGISSTAGGTFDATAASRENYAIRGTANATRSAGLNSLFNVAGLFTASGGQTNRALQTNDGDVVLNNTSGTTTINGATTLTSSLTVNGNTTIGDASTDSHTLNGALTVNGDVGLDGQVLSRQFGVPHWVSLSGVSGVSGTGSDNYYTKWFSSTSVTTGSLQEVTTGDVQLNNGTFSVQQDGGRVSGLKVDEAETGFAGSKTAIEASLAGSANCTAAVRTTIGADISASRTRSAGTNALTNIGIRATAAGGQTNVALKTIDGDVILNDNTGTTTVKGSASFTANVTLGDASTDSHTVNGDITFATGAAGGKRYVGSNRAFLYLGTRVFTTSAGSPYVPTDGTRAVRVRMVGGGGGGGSKYTLNATNVGGGGAGGMYVEKWIDPGTTITGSTYAIGAAGTAGNNSTGGNGGDTTIIIQGTTYTAKGGLGGQGNAWTSIAYGGAGQSVSQTVDVQHQQEGNLGNGFDPAGGAAFVFIGGAGGSNPLGSGGGQSANTGSIRSTGKTATGFGGGGGGMVDSVATGGTVVLGGAGTAGVIIIEEYA